jgi:hypothetical protein
MLCRPRNPRTSMFQVKSSPKSRKRASALLPLGNRWLRDISETKLWTRTTKPDAIILGTLLQGTRGMLFIVLNWILFVDYGRSMSMPSVDILAVPPSPSYFLLGFMDILMAKRLWSKGSNGWGYCVVMSAVICSIFFYSILLAPYSLNYWRYNSTILVIVVALFSMAEFVALVTPDARNY